MGILSDKREVDDGLMRHRAKKKTEKTTASIQMGEREMHSEDVNNASPPVKVCRRRGGGKIESPDSELRQLRS